jgi:hypothetical protein
MIQKLEINKKENTVEVFVCLKKKEGPRTPVTVFSWKDALKTLQERFPELVFSKPLEITSVLDNRKNILENTWVFPFTIKEEPKKEIISFNKKKDKKQQLQDLTKPQEPAIVKETSQRLSDQPVIVQEPTE